MKFRISYLFVFILVLSYCEVCFSAGKDVFKKGETIKYEVRSLGVKLGNATLVFNGEMVVNGKNVVGITFTAKGMNFYDEEKIFVDPETYYPVLIKRNLNIFGKKEKIIEVYDQEKGVVEITINSKRKTKHLLLKQNGVIENIYGFIFRYRKYGKFAEGNKVKMQLPTQKVNIEMLKKTSIMLAGKKYDAFLMKGSPKRLKVWFDVGPKKIPLKIKGAMAVGNTTMSMVEYLP